MMNERAMTLCELLSCKLALVSDGQLAEHWDISSATGRRHLTTWLNGLVRDDLIRRLRVLAKPTPKLDAPLLQVPRESPLGDMAALSWKLEKRWRIEPEVTTIYVRGPKCNQLFGGKAQPDISNLAAVSHDLALSALYFHFARAQPERARDWLPDWERKGDLRYGEKLPDVLLYDDDGSPYQAIEMGGSYPPGRLLALQVYCTESLQLPLEIW
ncbi:MAG: hypothetical protein WAN65_00120 [Candidatus Sulfotelmatobacter sp.]